MFIYLKLVRELINTQYIQGTWDAINSLLAKVQKPVTVGTWVHMETRLTENKHLPSYFSDAQMEL